MYIYIGLELWCLTPLSTYYSYIIAVSFIGGVNIMNYIYIRG